MAMQCRTILKRKQVEAVTGLSRSTIYAKLDPKSKQHDPDFPKALALGAQSVGWYADEIQAWVDQLPRAVGTPHAVKRASLARERVKAKREKKDRPASTHTQQQAA